MAPKCAQPCYALIHNCPHLCLDTGACHSQDSRPACTEQAQTHDYAELSH
jgi:hypothetical protein